MWWQLGMLSSCQWELCLFVFGPSVKWLAVDFRSVSGVGWVSVQASRWNLMLGGKENSASVSVCSSYAPSSGFFSGDSQLFETQAQNAKLKLDSNFSKETKQWSQKHGLPVCSCPLILSSPSRIPVVEIFFPLGVIFPIILSRWC